LAYNPTQKEQIMSLKRQDGTFESKPINYERDARASGINFQLSAQCQLFAPYSFLSRAEMQGEEEIILHYPFGMLRVKGEHLDFIYSMVQGHELRSINCATDETAKPEDPRIRQILFEKSSDDNY
jgi:hypothetical protein